VSNGETIHQICSQTGVSDYTIKGKNAKSGTRYMTGKRTFPKGSRKSLPNSSIAFRGDLRNDQLSPDRKAISIGVFVDKREKLGDSVCADLSAKWRRNLLNSFQNGPMSGWYL